MSYIPSSDDSDSAMRYEGLAMYAFDCKRGGGPNNVAIQGAYNDLLCPDLTEKGFKVINQILDALIEKESNNLDDLRTIKGSLTEKMKQLKAIELIDLIIKVIQD